MLAGKGNKLVLLGALRDLDSVLVEPGLEVALAPGAQKCISQGLLGLNSGARGGSSSDGSLVGSDTGVAADRGNKLIARARLRDRNATLVEPSLEIGIGPGLVQPVSGVSDGLANLIGNGLVVGASSLEKRVAGAGSRVRNTVVIEEGLDLRLGPAKTCQYGVSCLS